jgi:hypothetical protein
MTPRGTPAYTERADVGYSTPTTGLEVMSIDSGETGTSIAWGGTSGSAFCSLAIELALNVPPTVAPNTPADVATGQTTTPTLNFTGTDTNSDTMEYQVSLLIVAVAVIEAVRARRITLSACKVAEIAIFALRFLFTCFTKLLEMLIVTVNGLVTSFIRDTLIFTVAVSALRMTFRACKVAERLTVAERILFTCF